MNWKKFAITGVVAFVVLFTLAYVAHGVLLVPQYLAIEAKNPTMMRGEEGFMERMWVLTLGYLSLAFALTWIYAQGITRAPWMGQAIRFGIAACAAVTVPWTLVDYTVFMLPKEVALMGLALDSLSLLITCIVIGAMYRAEAGASQTRSAAA